MILLTINWANVLIMTCLGLGIVFLILCILVFILSLFGVFSLPKKKNTASSQKKVPQSSLTASEAEKAAIAMALHLYYGEIHDKESYVLSIKSEGSRNSSWNSKTYGINKLVK